MLRLFVCLLMCFILNGCGAREPEVPEDRASQEELLKKEREMLHRELTETQSPSR